jgi:hypothetical protein
MRAEVEARAALLRYGRRGLICDRPGVKSFGYHAFCGALLAELWMLEGWRWAGRAAAEAAAFLHPFVLPNGAALYVGRGQEQIFGYGALLYLLEAAAGMTGDERYGGLADRVFVRLTRFADYLPFLGGMLMKAANVDAPRVEGVKEHPPPSDFRVVRRGRYTAVLARPGGASTNDLAFPYVCVDRESLFPCYGREGDEAPSEAVPLPFGVLASGETVGFRELLRYELTGDGLVGKSRETRHLRRFTFEEHGFECMDEIIFRRRQRFARFAPANFLFRTLTPVGGGRFETWHRGMRAELAMEPVGQIVPGATVSASGTLVGLRHTMEELEPRAGERVITRLRVRFL